MTDDEFETGPEDAHFELEFSPNESLVSTVRRFVSEFYKQVLADPDGTSRLAVATHELLDNAVQYSSDGNTSIRIGVHRTGDAVNVTIDTKNRADSSRIADVRTVLDELMAASDAVAHYQILMRRSAKRTEGSGLGLGRVRAEAEMRLSYRCVGDVVHLRARARFDAGLSSTLSHTGGKRA